MDLIEALHWRYATKRMNGQHVPKEKLAFILEAARLAPSSSGLQPYQIIVISNEEMKKRIKRIAYDQSQITDASHLLVFAAWDRYSQENIEEVFARTIAERKLQEHAMDIYKQALWDKYEPLGREWQAEHTAKQAYISFGFAIAAAALQKVDATPMEGFDPAALDDLLDLPRTGFRSTVILAVGYRDETQDWLVHMKKVRTDAEKFITLIS